MNLRSLIILGFLIPLISGCKNSTEPTETESTGLEGITETAETGFSSFIGNIDTTDWSKSSYDGIYFGGKFWFRKPNNNKIEFYSNTPNQKVSTLISLFNSSESAIILTSTVDYPFSLNESILNLIPHKMNVLEISYTLPDTITYFFQDTLFLNFSSGEKYNVSLVTFAERDTGVHEQPVKPTMGGMYPAYPNPTSSSTTINIALPQYNLTSIIVKNNLGEIVKTIVDEPLSPGSYYFNWDLTDNNNQKLSPGFYRAYFSSGLFQDKGDIKIE